jgi:hypothetical protein
MLRNWIQELWLFQGWYPRCTRSAGLQLDYSSVRVAEGSKL